MRESAKRALCCALLLGFATVSAADDGKVTQALLDALRANGQLTEQQYQEIRRMAEEAGDEDRDFRVYYKDGIRFEDPDGDFKIQIGGRIQNDWALVDESRGIEAAFGEQGDGTELRRARLYVAGTVHEIVKFKAQYDFAGGDADFKDVYIELAELPVLGAFRVGHFKEPFSLEEQTSSKYLTFMERGLPNVFSPSRNTGLMVHDAVLDGNATFAVGAFREVDDFAGGFGTDSTYNVTARVTATPWYADEGRRLLHTGFSYSHKFRADDGFRFRQRPEAHLLDRFVDTGTIPADDIDLINPELAAVLGPVSVQGEYMRAFVDDVASDADFEGFYVQGSVFLTGEHRPYKQSSGSFSRLDPERDFDMKGGPGAIELAARFSHLDLEDSGIDGGRLDDWTAGVNWYLNRNLRATLNYVYADVQDGGHASIYQTRVQLEF